jgi:drug/metabolite transporter (DMT)-like permease
MWQWYAVVAMACFAAMQLIFKDLARRGVSSPAMLLVVFALGTVLYLVHVRALRTPLPLDGQALARLGVAALLAYVGNFYSVRALAAAPNPGYSIAIVGLQAVVVTLAAVLLFGAALSWTKLLGVVLCFAGLVLVVL